MTRAATWTYQLFMTGLVALGLAEAVFTLVDTERATETVRLAAAQAAAGTSVVSANPFSSVLLKVGAVEVIFAAALVFVLAWRAPRRPEARALAIFLSYWLVPVGLMIMGGFPVAITFAGVTALEWVRTAALLRFAALFPRPLAVADLAEARRRVRGGRIRGALRTMWHAAGTPLRWPVTLALRWAGRPVPADFRLHDVPAALCLRPGVVWGIAAIGTAAMFAVRMTGHAVLAAILWLLMLAVSAQGLMFLFTNYRVAGAAERRRLLWVVQGFYAAAWIVALTFAAFIAIIVRWDVATPAAAAGAFPSLAFTVVFVGAILVLFVMLASLGVAIFYTGALDPALILRQTTAYGILTFAAGIGFAVIEQVAASTVQRWLHLSSGFSAGVAGVVVALGVGPLRERISRFVAKRGGKPAAGVETTV